MFAGCVYRVTNVIRPIGSRCDVIIAPSDITHESHGSFTIGSSSTQASLEAEHLLLVSQIRM